MPPAPTPAPRWRVARNLAVAARGIWRLLAALLVLVALLVGALVLLDQPVGHRFVLKQLDRISHPNGIGVSASGIEGSLFGELTVRDLAVRDQHGVFLTAPRVDIDWRPRDFITNRLTLRSALAGDVYVRRLPDLLPTDDPNILPDFDIFIGRLRIDRLHITGSDGADRRFAVAGNADVRDGRALVSLDAVAGAGPNGSGDRVVLRLDAEPDRDRFDVDADVRAVKGGALLALSGFAHPAELQLRGDGSWRVWQGRLRASAAIAGTPTPLADLTLGARRGNFTLAGRVMPAPLLSGPAARLAAPALDVAGELTLADGRGDTQLRLSSRALQLVAAGEIDFDEELYRGFTIDARLLRPQDLDARLAGDDIKLRARLAGKLAAPLVDYLATATRLSLGTTRLTAPRVSGVVQLGKPQLVVPVTASAARVSGAGAAADALLTNVRLDTQLALLPTRLEARALTLTSDRLRARGSAAIERASGNYTATIAAELPRYALTGIGTADVTANVNVGGNGAKLRVGGTARAALTRLDSSATRDFFGGLPVVAARFDLAPDGALALHEVRFTAPALTLNGEGAIAASGAVRLAGGGTLRDYGPVRFAVSGPADRLVFDLKLPAPGLAGDIRNIEARVAATARGWAFNADASSSAGPISAEGVVLTGSGPLTVELTRLTGADLTASGRLVQTPSGPFAGLLQVKGRGVDGSAELSAQGGGQHAEIRLDLNKAVLPLATPVAVARGTATASVQLDPGKGPPTLRASLALADVERGTLRIAKAEGRIAYARGVGAGELSFSGDAGAPFAGKINADFAPERVTINGSGNLGNAPLRLEEPAVLTRADGSWLLAPTTLITPNGRIEASGSFGRRLALQLQLERVGLGLARIINPALDLSGTVSGGIALRYGPDDQLPEARANLRVNGLTRAGLGTASNRIDLGINALMTGGSASARMVIAREGRIEGRAQAQLAVIPGSRADPVLTRLFAAPLFAQLRWAGPAEAIWPLAGVDRVDVRGPLSIAIDGSGVLGDPHFAGAVRMSGARIESTGIGLVLDKVALDSRFVESRLELKSFTATAGRDGTVSASGGIDLSAVRGFPMEFALAMKNAQLINRDDLRGSATGQLRIHKGDDGALISGALDIDQARINLGTGAAADVPVLPVTEINGAAARRPVARPAKPTIWQLDMKVEADNRIAIRGMGLDSEWSANVRVTGSIEAPRVAGKVALVRGDYDFAGKRFALTRGDIRFTGNYPPDPIINVTAENTSSNFTATLNITGTAQRPEISFSSVPALPEDEVLSRVLFGESVTNLSAPEALQLAGALATLRGGSGGLNPVNAVRKGLGIDRLRILPADTARGRKTSIAAGQYIGDRVYIEVTSDAQGYTATSVEVSLTRSLSILSEIATLGGTSLSVRWKRDY